jgi:hypothetical protein
MKKEFRVLEGARNLTRAAHEPDCPLTLALSPRGGEGDGSRVRSPHPAVRCTDSAYGRAAARARGAAYHDSFNLGMRMRMILKMA